ncbi:MAG TPA: ATP-binding protein [Thermodesulfobacteriota bacterium]|nr:ATP-binding protein [Thermodesulfobacteriota bacterium]
MKLSIFSRMMISYLAIFILVTAVSSYAIVKIRQFNKTTKYILAVDNRILGYGKKLTDFILSQSRFERKFILTKDQAFYDQFLSAKEDFLRVLTETLVLADTSSKKDTLNQIKKEFENYQSLFDEEVKLVRSKRDYSRMRFELEKQKRVDTILEELETLGVQSQQDIFQRMEMLGVAGDSARKMVIGMAITAMVLVLLTSFFITRTITRPLKVLVDKTRDISRGIFDSQLNISSPPEVLELARAFNTMCEKLRALDKMKSDFFSSMSHELRTPLTSIKEGISLLKDGVGGTVPERQKRLLTILTLETNRLITLVSSLLDLSKMEAGMMTYTFAKRSLAPLIERAMIEMVPLVESKKIRLEQKGFESLPTLRMDSERILQVLRNLMGNAVKFTPEGGRVTISARQVNQEVEVSVADTGPGIPAEKLTTIFDKYQQADGSGSYRMKGTGLGLSIAQHVVSSHGGRIWAESRLGEGSIFIFVLPA